MKIVVFDLDETLGYFTELGIFWDCLKHYLKQENKSNPTQTDFNDVLDLFPEFLRPNIINILTYLKKRKESRCCHKMMIYTNNTGPPEWAHHIISYFESKIKYKLIDQLIAAFKINGKQVEICRTTHSKTHKDLIRCTKIPPNAEICFLDDVYHPKMVDERVYYIKLQAYHSYIPFHTFVVRFLNSALYRDVFDKFAIPSITPGISSVAKKQILSIEIHNLFVKYANMAEYDAKAQQQKIYPREIDEIISKYILYHLQQFFRDGPPIRRTTPAYSRKSAKTAKKNRSSSSTSHNNNVFYVDKATAVKNMRNKTIRNR